jgi:NitT/TauT family transport system substrate-binding protein
MRRWQALGALALVVLILGCAPTAPSAANSPAPASGGAAAASARPIKLRAATTSVTGSGTPLWAGYEGGYFAREGLDVEIGSFPSGTEGVSALIAGEVDFLQGAGSTTISAALGGAELVVLATTAPTMILSIVSRPEITQPDQMRGQALAISRLGTSTETAARLALRQWGLEADRDVSIVQAGSTASILGAMDSNRVQAGVVGHPTVTQARKMGLNLLIDLGTLNVPYFNSGVGARRAFVAERPDVVRRYLRGVVAGIHRVRADKPFALSLYRKYLETDDADVLEDTYEVYGLKYAPPVPYPDAPGIQGVLDELAAENPRAREVSPSDFYDDRFVRELEDSGYIQSLSR